MDWNEAKKIMLENVEVRKELKNREAGQAIIKDIIRARKEKSLTQKEVAELVGTKQSNISRLESGNYNPSLELLYKIAAAVGKRLEVKLL